MGLIFAIFACRGGLVGYDAALTRLRSWVQFPFLVIFAQKTNILCKHFCLHLVCLLSWSVWSYWLAICLTLCLFFVYNCHIPYQRWSGLGHFHPEYALVQQRHVIPRVSEHQSPVSQVWLVQLSHTTVWHQKNITAPTGNRTQGKCLEGIYVTTTPSAHVLTHVHHHHTNHFISDHALKQSVATPAGI